MKDILRLCCFIFLLITPRTHASSIILNNKDAVVWLPTQTVSGKLTGFQIKQLTIHHNQNLFFVNVNNDSSFSFEIELHDKENKLWITAEKQEISSDTLKLILGYHPMPVIKPYAIIIGNKATLHAKIIDNPSKQSLHFFWTEAKDNPAQCRLRQYDSVTSAEIPFIEGVYYFNLLVTSGKDSAWFQTFVTKKEKQLHAFDISAEHAAWIDDAVIYEITPSRFVKDATYDDITAKLPELKNLGINTIWLQPVFQTEKGGQGYDITDYFSLRTDLGSEQQLEHLIDVAKSLHLHVLFDFVPNHTSIDHPYAEDCLKYGAASHYYNFYQHEKDGAKYSSRYKKDSSEFINYFWKDLVNLNYNNPEVQQWIIEACKYWIRKFDIDGYRFDAVWAVNARAPSFGTRLRIELKSIKPDLFLLAEDKASDEQVYEKGFDAAFDWTTDTSWISQWSWQLDFKSNTSIFNFPDVNKRGMMLQQALFNNGNSTHPRLRFIENNDLPRFIKTHNLKQTEMAAALLFSLPGIPLIYNGQEIGFTSHPYSNKPIFEASRSIQSLDSNHLFSYYQKLILLRMQYSSLRDTTLKEVPVSPTNTLVAFHRWKNDEHFIIVINLDSISKEASVDLNKIAEVSSGRKYFLKDVLDKKESKVNITAPITIQMEAYSIRWLLLKLKK